MKMLFKFHDWVFAKSCMESFQASSGSCLLSWNWSQTTAAFFNRHGVGYIPVAYIPPTPIKPKLLERLLHREPCYRPCFEIRNTNRKCLATRGFLVVARPQLLKAISARMIRTTPNRITRQCRHSALAQIHFVDSCFPPEQSSHLSTQKSDNFAFVVNRLLV
jgi:hypothetical protein